MNKNEVNTIIRNNISGIISIDFLEETIVVSTKNVFARYSSMYALYMQLGLRDIVVSPMPGMNNTLSYTLILNRYE